MSQAGIVDIEGSHPQVPTSFVTNSGTAIPIANTLEILGSVVDAYGIPLQTTASGNTITIVAQYASAHASSVAANAGLASFNSSQFTVDANGFVTLQGSGSVESFQVDTFTAPGTNPVIPNGSGIVTITGGQVAAGTTTNVIRTDSLAASTYTIQIQRSQAVASSTIGDNGVSHFNSSYFTVDANGFVSLNGSGVAETITGSSGGPLTPTGGNWNILGSGSITSAGSGSTLTIELTGLTNHAVQVGGSGTTLTQVGPSATTGAVLASNGASSDPSFQTISSLGGITTIDGDSGSMTPTSGVVTISGGTTGLTTSASSSTMNLTGTLKLANGGTNANLTASNGGIFYSTASAGAILAGTATADQVLLSGSSTTPAWSTATYPATTTINQLLYSSSNNVIGGITAADNGVLISGTTGIPSWLANSGTPGYVLTANSSASPSWQSITAQGAVTTIDGDSGSATPSSGVITFNANSNAGSTVEFSATSHTVDLLVSDANSNTIIGSGAGNGSVSGLANTGVGFGALHIVSSGADNTAFGYGSGGHITTGSSNTAIGRNTLANVIGTLTGSYNTCIGDTAGANYTTSEASNIQIGYNVAGTLGESNVLRIGVATGTSAGNLATAYIQGIAGNSVSNQTITTINSSTGQLGNVAQVPVANGGTGDSSFTAYMPITGGTTTTAALQSVATGTAGYVLTYNTSSSLPTWQPVPGTEMAWTDESTSFNAVASNGYFITANATATLPPSPSQGTLIQFAVDTTSVLTLQANTGQVIRIGSAVSASAGTAASNARGDSLSLVFRSSGSAWIATSVIGIWTTT